MPSQNRLIVPALSKRSLAACLATALGVSGTASAAELAHAPEAIVVTSCADGGPGSLRDAVQGDTSGVPIDLSHLSCSTITLTTGAIEATRSLTLIGPGATSLTIDGNHQGAVIVEAAIHARLSIQGMTVQNGYVVNGYGGCLFSAGPIILDDVVVTGCKVAAHGIAPGQQFSGGGIEARGDFTATDSRIVNNALEVSVASAHGGGIRTTYNATLINTTISDNAVDMLASFGTGYYEFAEGGGLFAEGNVTMMRSTISNNTAHSEAASGGGAVWSNGYTSMYYSTLSGNSALGVRAQSYCGGVCAGTHIRIDHSTISGNTSDIAGGAFAGGFSYARVTNSTISGNTALRAGGIAADDFSAYNSTIAFNVETDGDRCGGICVYLHSLALVSSIVAGNTSSNEAPGNIGTFGGRLTVSGQHNVIGASRYDVTFPDDTITLDPMLAPLADNGGPTFTHALLPGSPAIDMGIVLGVLHWDQRGQGYARTIDSAPDIGAFEAPLQDQRPTAVDDGFTTFENKTLTVGAPGVLANDSDADGDALSAVVVDDVSNGSLTLNADGGMVYVPATDFFGTDSFTYEITDGEMTSNLATVTIEVQQVVDTDVIFVSGFE